MKKIRRRKDPKTGKDRPHDGRRFVGLGRRKQEPDERDNLHRVPRKRSVRAATAATYKVWGDRTWRGDQGQTPQCVAYSALHRIENSPKTYPEPGSVLVPQAVYDEAQAIDEWPGTNYDGTSVRAGAKVMLAHGFISEYQWCQDMQDFITTLLTLGPVVAGSAWDWSMFDPVYRNDAAGTRRMMIAPDGDEAGGHAYLFNAINLDGRVARILNSWGPSWGANGRVWMDLNDVEALLFGRGGEACVYREVRP